jgi:TRAP-type C4-dicarboxylate transport system substrate-binding protein
LITVIRAVAISALASGLATLPAATQAQTVLRVLGQPLAAGPIQKNKEQPFFETLAARTGLPLRVEYVPHGSGAFANVDPLAALRAGQVDIAALRISEAGRSEPSLLGLDLFGLNTDYGSARQVTDAYWPILDRRLQERIGVKLIGLWPFGPEVLFCNKPLTRLSDIRGLKVRVYDPDSAKLVEAAGGTPVQLGFAAASQGLSTRTIDCAIGSPTAAVASGWAQTATHIMPIAFQLGINAFGVSLPAWSKLAPDHQSTLMSAIQSLTDDIWSYSEKLSNDAIGCSTGILPCESGQKFNLAKVPVTDSDVTLVRASLRDSSLPRWAQACDAVDPGCSASWKQVVGPLVGIR